MSGSRRHVTLQVEIPGGQHARYEAAGRGGQQRLVEVVYPRERFPGDLCQVTGTLTLEERPLAALLLGIVTHPAGCYLDGRVVGLLAVSGLEEGRQIVLAVAAGDPHFEAVQDVAQLTELLRRQMALAFALDGGDPQVEICWRDRAAAEEVLVQARQRYRLAEAERREMARLGPAWRPLRGVAVERVESEAKRHTAAEHAFYQLPFRFQNYVSAYLAHDERILFGLRRLAMRSALQGSFWRGKRLEEAVLVISTQQIAEVAELMPPDRAAIRYGFIARSAPLERLESVALHQVGRDVVALAISLRGSGGVEKVSWEFPAGQRPALEEALSLLQGWLAHPDDHRVQRATPPEAPEELESLVDPGTNDPAGTARLASRLEQALAQTVAAEEPVLARCLLPSWIKQRGEPSLLAVTPQRLLVVTEPGAGKGLRLELPLHAITSFTFSSTLIRSYLRLHTPAGAGIKDQVIHFGMTLGAMDACYRALRQATSVAPAADVNVFQQSTKE